MKELLPCPFCGSVGILHEGRNGCYVVCQNTELPNGNPCDMGNTHNDWTREAAIEMWNQRLTHGQKGEG